MTEKQLEQVKKTIKAALAHSDFYRKKLVEYGAMRNLPNKIKTMEGKWIKQGQV